MRDNPEIACTGCAFGGEPVGPVGFYDLGDDMRCQVYSVTAYCCAEGRLRAAEKFLDVEEYEEALAEREALAEVEEKDEITGFLITRDVRAWRIAMARAALTWRRHRTSPPRCLRCGSTDVVPLEWGEEPVRHPGCPGNGDLYYRGFIVRKWRGGNDAYDREGRFLREAPRDPHDRADIECTGCNFGGRVWSTQKFYELESGVRFPLCETTAWCLEEERLFVAEDLQSVDSYEAILAAIETLPDIEQEETRAALEWRRKRTDPPRCLSCGSPDIVPLPTKGGISHPGCRGRGELRYEQLVRHDSCGVGGTYDANGHRVRDVY